MLAGQLVGAPVEQALFTFFSQSIDIGKVGVTVFFAISGFVVPFSLFSASTHPIRRFTMSRLFRLYPAYWLSMLVAVLVFHVAAGEPVPARRVIANATMLQQFVGAANLMQIYWTLQVELIFYALCGVLFWRGCLKASRHVFAAALVCLALALVVAAARWYWQEKLPVAAPLALCIMFWGFLWRRHTIDHQPDARRYAHIVLAALIVAVPVISLLAYNRDYGFDETWSRYTATYYAALFVFIAGTTRLRVTGAVPEYLGRISYSVYLFGTIAAWAAFRLMGDHAGEWPAHVTLLIAVLIAVAMAAVSYHVVEQPAIQWGRRLSRRWVERS